MRNALVTGADRGLGYSVVGGLLERDWTVYAGQYLPDWPGLASLKQDYPERLHIVPLDVSSAGSVKWAAESISLTCTALDAVFNVAGMLTIADAETGIRGDLPLDDIVRTFAVNTFGPLYVVHYFLDLLLHGEGKLLVTISTESGSIARCSRTTRYGYSGSKAALNMFTKMMHNDLAADGVQVYLIHPGWMNTYILGGGLNTPQAPLQPDDVARQLLAHTLDSPHRDELVFEDLEGGEWPW
jgi:NAD(P)-dependent dehydrogenase (short-subunit alcohol dehydrogenase family)